MQSIMHVNGCVCQIRVEMRVCVAFFAWFVGSVVWCFWVAFWNQRECVEGYICVGC